VQTSDSNSYAVFSLNPRTSDLEYEIMDLCGVNLFAPLPFTVSILPETVLGSWRKKTLPVKQPSLQMNHQLNKPNLQKPKKNEDGSYSIPTIVNGVTNVNSNAKLERKYCDSLEISINKLRQTINICNKEEYAVSL